MNEIYISKEGWDKFQSFLSMLHFFPHDPQVYTRKAEIEGMTLYFGVEGIQGMTDLTKEEALERIRKSYVEIHEALAKQEEMNQELMMELLMKL